MRPSPRTEDETGIHRMMVEGPDGELIEVRGPWIAKSYHNNPDDLSAYRWQAMARWYEAMGLLNE